MAGNKLGFYLPGRYSYYLQNDGEYLRVYDHDGHTLLKFGYNSVPWTAGNVPLATATPPQEHPLPLAAGVVVTRPSKYSRAKDGLVVVTYNLSFPSSEGRTKVLFTLPAGYRPFVMISAPCIVSTSPGDVIAPATVEVYESGLVQVYANASGYTNSAGQIVFYAS